MAKDTLGRKSASRLVAVLSQVATPEFWAGDLAVMSGLNIVQTFRELVKIVVARGDNSFPSLAHGSDDRAIVPVHEGSSRQSIGGLTIDGLMILQRARQGKPYVK